ncbi:TetR/AcrR family transcriptional regulator [Pseudonocardia sp. CA-107938]|uniref:TetR/AcrR family transcriptional regulator n=1 Tax=Pseudonocardia sp. CA-107938 TaxID=3240021 RepID=UPI003D8E9ABA
MPKLWNATIETHRKEVRDAVLDATAALVAEHGLRSVTMAQIAERAGIGRATLYKYFSTIDAILHAWHHREVTDHLRQLTDVRDSTAGGRQQLEAVLQEYARISHRTQAHHDTEMATLLHRDEHVAHAQRLLHALVSDLIADGARDGDLRADVVPDELATYCLHALAAARSLPTEAAVDRLITVTLAGLLPNAVED